MPVAIRLAALVSMLVLLLAGCGRGGFTRAQVEDIVLTAPLPDHTYLFYGGGHGFQIEYYTENGAFLWYPGNDVVLPGQWRVEGEKICFRYFYNTYNPATKTSRRSGEWECRPIDHFRDGSIVAREPGDVFSLADRKVVPYPLQHCVAPPEFNPWPRADRFEDCDPEGPPRTD